MSSNMITINKFDRMNYAQCAIEMAIHIAKMPVYGIIKEYNDKPEEPAANVTAIGKAACKDGMDILGVARSTILLGMEAKIQAEYTVVEDVKTLWEKLASGYTSKLKLNMFGVRKDLWSIKLLDCGDVDNKASQMAWNVLDCFLCAGHRLLTLMRMMQRQSPRCVSKRTSSTAFTESKGTTTGQCSWSSWWVKTPLWPRLLMW